MSRFPRASRLLLLAATAVPAAARAQTTAGITITNTATATYTVNGTPNSVSSNPASFKVDRKVNLVVERDQTGTTEVTAGQQGAVARFKVTNTTNGYQDFLLYPHQTLDFPISILPGTEDFDVTALKAVVDDGDGIYDPAPDTATYVDELAPDTSRVVYLVGNIPATAGQHQAFVALEAVVATGGGTGSAGAALIPTDLNLLNQDNEVDIVFADNDSDGLLAPDLLHNGRGWAYAAFELGATSLNVSVVKTATVLFDGVSAINPKALPGATVQYCMTIANATPLTAATNLSLTDVVPAGTTYVPNSIAVGLAGTAGVCLTGGVSIADNGSTTGTYRGSYDTATRTVTATIPLLAGGTSVAASFRVIIN